MRLSVSRLQMLQRCGMQYLFRYVEGIVSPPGVALIVGKGTHRAIASDLLAKMDGGELLPDEQVKDIAADAAKREWDAQPVALDDDEKAKGADVAKGEAIDRAVVLAGLHHAELAPTIEPTAIEREVKLRLPSGDDFLGYIDVTTETAIHDTKTTGKTPDKNAAENSQQLTGYLWADWELGGRKKIKSGRLDHLVSTKTPKAVTQDTTRGLAEFAALHDRLALASQTIGHGVFQPCPPDSWCCSPKWCGYWDRCPFGARGRIR